MGLVQGRAWRPNHLSHGTSQKDFGAGAGTSGINQDLGDTAHLDGGAGCRNVHQGGGGASLARYAAVLVRVCVAAAFRRAISAPSPPNWGRPLARVVCPGWPVDIQPVGL
jgi:hypothetical protein